MTADAIKKPIDPAGKQLLSAFLLMALGALALGGLSAAAIALARAPAIAFPADPLFYYRMLTVHGLAMFYHWFLFFQGALLLLAVGLYVPGVRPFSLRLGWLAFAAMAAGAAIQWLAGLWGGEVLYTAFPPLAAQYPRSPLIYLGFILLALGILLLAVNYMATVVVARRSGLIGELPTPTYVGLVWTIVMTAASVIALGIYTPALLWSIGVSPIDPMAYTMGYFTFFHVNHYVPLIAAVGVWYALAKQTTGAESVLGERFSKAVFTAYPLIVPPTFLYHLFLAPGVPAGVKTAGSILSLLIGVPTIIVSIVVLGMLEARMRAAGAQGAFGWLRRLPWGSPPFAGLAMGMLTFGLGGAFAYALLSERLAPLLHGTFVVPGYFHAFTSAGVTLTFMAATYALLPALTGRRLWGLALARLQPYLMAGGAAIFVVFGVAAGYAGAPRRVSSIAYAGAAPQVWAPLMNVTEAVGGLLMVVAGLLFFAVVAGTLLARRSVPEEEATAPSTAVEAGSGAAGMTWAAAMPAVLVVVTIVAVSIGSFELMRRWPFLVD
ncbi:MAG: cbb3-type cytochrome c oxidase subunit I [Chloroflexi bacterium]|nr:cbb3-type cytochrome c oxidase subunit I [Chloroflexota bacterium]